MQAEPAAEIYGIAQDEVNWGLDRLSPVPLYVQIKQRLLLRIAHWPDGRRFYTDHELGALFHVNRLTVRQAVAELVEEGFLVRLRRAGTFVRRDKIEERFTPRMDFLDQWASQGEHTRAEALVLDQRPAPDDVARALGIPGGAAVLFVRRRRLAGAVPMSIDDRWFPPDVAAGLTAEDVARRSLLDVLWRTVELSHCDLRIEASTARPEDAELLKLVPDAPLLLRHLRYLARDGRVVMVGRSRYRADLVRHVIRVPLRRGAGEDAAMAGNGQVVPLPVASRPISSRGAVPASRPSSKRKR